MHRPSDSPELRLSHPLGAQGHLHGVDDRLTRIWSSRITADHPPASLDGESLIRRFVEVAVGATGPAVTKC
jgi:hypothetical protein